jgi:hypothetical protein
MSEITVVAITLLERLGEYRGVRCNAAQFFLGDALSQAAADDHSSRQITHPAALAVNE